MKKITSPKLINRLTKYGALSTAIVGVADANGQIVYTDIGDIVGTVNTYYDIDLNNDAVGDIRILGGGLGSDYSTLPYVYPSAGFVVVRNAALNGGAIPALGSNSFLGSAPGYIYPFAMSSGAPIGVSQATWFNALSSVGTMNFASCFGSGGSSNWCGVTDMYLGLRFTVLNGPGPSDDTIHYGWARMDVSLDSFTWVVKDYAYESTPGLAIAAGDTGVLSVDDKDLTRVKIVALNKSIALYNLPEKADYNLFSISGQSVLKGSTSLDTHVIEANTLATGVYILELKGTDSKAVIRKKVTL